MTRLNSQHTVRRETSSTTVCPYCDQELTDENKTLDHREPLSNGGLHSIGNVLVVCQSCNSQKGDISWSQWRDNMARLTF